MRETVNERRTTAGTLHAWGWTTVWMLVLCLGAQAALAAKSHEIPVTTESKKAKKAFLEGQALLDVGRGIEANRAFARATELDPTFAFAYVGLANSALSFPQFQTAVEQASRNLEGKSDGERLLVEVAASFLSNDTDEGLSLAKRLSGQYPGSVRALLTLSAMHANRNEHEEARRALTRARMKDTTSAAALSGLGFSYLFNEPKDFAKAEGFMARWVEVSPREAKAYEGLGDVKRAQGELSAALTAYSRATELDSGLAQAQLKKGHVHSFLGDISGARRAYDAALGAATPENKASYANYRAFTHLHAGDVDAALAELDRVAEGIEAMGTPEHQVQGIRAFTLTNCVRVALHHGLLDRATELVEKRSQVVREMGVSIGTEDAKRLQEANALTWEGLLAAAKGEMKQAEAKAEQIASLLGDDRNARRLEPYHQVLGAAYLQQKDYRQAAEHLAQANLNNLYVKYELALAEQGAGQLESATRRFGEVASWNFNSVDFALVRKDADRKTS